MLLGALLVGHGIAHVVGFVVPWKLITSTEVPYKTTVLAGALDVGPAGVRIIGLIWLLVSIAFISLATGLQQHASWWYRDAFATAAVSLALCALGWPESRPGVVANVALLGILVAAGLLGWYPEASFRR
jgi:hypothetical protein